eukprot:362159-Chlamydomonas_euryale.AAC.10
MLCTHLPHPAAVELSNAARPPQVCARELRAVDVHTFHAQQLQPVLLAQRRRAVRKPGRQLRTSDNVSRCGDSSGVPTPERIRTAVAWPHMHIA